MKYDVEIIRSKRKTLSLQVNAQGKVIARAPLNMKLSEIERFVNEKSAWLDKHIAAAEQRQSTAGEYEPFTREDIEELARKALEIIPERVAYYAPLVGVRYGRITVRNQLTRWGSCSGRGNLNFNCLLMLTPAEVIDSVVVHELCHIKEMNHSKRCYAEVLRVYPDYYKWDKWLKENGRILMARMRASLNTEN